LRSRGIEREISRVTSTKSRVTSTKKKGNTVDALVAEYRALPPSSDDLPDEGDNDRKCVILIALDTHANQPSVTRLLLDVLRNKREFDLARVEAIQVAGLYVTAKNPLHRALMAELRRMAESKEEDEMLRGWAQRYVSASPEKKRRAAAVKKRPSK